MTDTDPSSAPDGLPSDARDDRTAAAAVETDMPGGQPGGGGLGGDAAAAAAVSMALAGGPVPAAAGSPGFPAMTEGLAPAEAGTQASDADRATDRTSST